MLPLRLLLWLVIVLVVFVDLIPNSFAAPGDILLTDNFNDGNLDGWTIESGNWYINNGNLAGSKSGILFGGKINTGSSEWDNYRIELDVNGFQGIDQGIELRYTSDSSYKIHLRYDPGRKQYGTPEIRLEKNNGTDNILLTNTLSFPLISNKWYHLKIEALNENIKFWIDNTLIFDFTDANTNIKKGTLALSYWSGELGIAYMKFDNIKITALAPPPPPRLPVIFIPGIGGSEFQANEIIPWKDRDDGHGGQYSYVYAAGEKIWVNSDEAVKLGNDDYFDVLRLKEDGQTSEADISLTGNLTSFGYQDLDSFFTDMGYIKGTNYFVFPYDWRKDVRNTKDNLDALIEGAKQKSGQPQVNLVVHSLGGLVGRFYISDSTKAAKVNKLIELGVPHLGAVHSLKTLMYGTWLARDLYLIKLGIVPPEVKDVFQNLPSAFQLLPSQLFFNFYDNSNNNLLYPFKDDRDIDSDKVTGSLNFNQIKNLLTNLNYNMSIFSLAEQFHNTLDPQLNQTNGAKIYKIVGTGQPTLGQIHETWWITWPINLIPKTDEIYINGDGTVPLYSASLKNDSLDLSGATKIYYVEQEHGNLPSINGAAMQTVKAILNDDNALPVEVKDIKIDLEGEQISFDDGELDLYDEQDRHCGLNSNGEIEENIPEVTCTTSGSTKHAFIKKKAKKVKVTATRKKPTVNSKTTTIKKRTYQQNKVSKTTIYKDLNLSPTAKIEFTVDPGIDTSQSLTFYPDSTKPETLTVDPTSEAQGGSALDQTPPATSIQITGTKDTNGIYTGPVTITLTASDLESGILTIEYSLDNGQTVQTYTKPFTISDSGKTTIQIKSIDKLGNEEIPQTIIIEIAAQATPTPTSTTSTSTDSGSSSSDNTSSTDTNNIVIASYSPAKRESEATKQSSQLAYSIKVEDSSQSLRNDNGSVLGTTFDNPHHIADQINLSNFLDKQKNPSLIRKQTNPATEILGGLLMISGGIATIASVGLLATFLKPIPK